MRKVSLVREPSSVRMAKGISRCTESVMSTLSSADLFWRRSGNLCLLASAQVPIKRGKISPYALGWDCATTGCTQRHQLPWTSKPEDILLWAKVGNGILLTCVNLDFCATVLFFFFGKEHFGAGDSAACFCTKKRVRLALSCSPLHTNCIATTGGEHVFVMKVCGWSFAPGLLAGWSDLRPQVRCWSVIRLQIMPLFKHTTMWQRGARTWKRCCRRSAVRGEQDGDLQRGRTHTRERRLRWGACRCPTREWCWNSDDAWPATAGLPLPAPQRGQRPLRAARPPHPGVSAVRRCGLLGHREALGAAGSRSLERDAPQL